MALRSKSRLIAVSLFLFFAGVVTRADAQTLATDQLDYPPGTTVTFSGAGFEPGEWIAMEVRIVSSPSGAHGLLDSWGIYADESGSFVTTWEVCPELCVGATLQGTADGWRSGLHADCYFTDATVWSMGMSPPSAAVGQTQTYVLTAQNTSTGGGNQMGCITVTIPPSFTPVGSPSIVAGSTTHAWSVSRVGQVITATANSNGDRIDPGEGIQITQTATAPASPAGSPFSWTSVARTNINCSGSSFGIPEGGQPSVSVSCTPAAITCPPNITVNNDPGSCSAVVHFSVSGSGGPAPVITYSHGSGSAFSVGTTTVTATATNACGAASCSFTVTVVDNSPPTVTLAGADPMTIECHTAFVDPGASATDNCPGALPVSVSGAVNPNVAGTYVLTYGAVDASGNPSSKTRTVHVVDTTNPVVSLNGADDMTLECHGPAFSDPGASASDACAGDLSVSVSGSLDVNTVGDYVLTYSANDPSGNSDSKTRTVHVVDTTNPVVSLNGADDVTLECHGPAFSDPGATASDACAGDLSVSVSGSVDVNTVGDYVLTYSAGDPSGNSDSKTRTVHVVDTTNPVVSLNGADELTLECHGPVFSDPGASASDACAGDLAVSVSGSVDVNTVGDYVLTYSAGDPSGNSDSKTRTVHVFDTTPPVIGAAGPDGTIECSSAPVFTPPSASDACDSSPQVVEVDDVTTAGGCPGVYTRTKSWKAMDAEGNSSPIVSQTIHVVDSTPPLLGAAGSDATIACPATPAFTAPTASDGCDPAPVVLEVSDVTVPGACAGSYTRTKTWRAQDCSGNLSAPVSQTITVDDPTPPSAEITAPANGTVVAAGTPVTFKGIVADNCGLQSARWQFDNILVPAGTIGVGDLVSTPYTFTQPGVYQIKLTASDECGNETTDSQTADGFDWTVIVYDPNAGFVTGGGWIQSPLGAYRPNEALEGKANFGFVSKYQKGARVPTGETEFQFKAGNMNFHSTTYEWLVVAGAKAQYKGCGKINGSGDYGFMLTGIDGALQGGGLPDRFRVKIWDRATSAVVYDNQFGQAEDSDASTALGGGSIVVHSGKGVLAPAALMAAVREVTQSASAQVALEFAVHPVQPNPSRGNARFAFDVAERSQVRITVLDVRGRFVATVADGEWDPGRHSTAWTGRGDRGESLEAGVYFVRYTLQSLVSERRLSSVTKLVLSP